MAGQDVEWNEVQGIVLSAYWAKSYTRYFLLTIRDGREQDARKWLRLLIEQKKASEDPWGMQGPLGPSGPWLSFNDDRSRNGLSLNIAFTFSGLRKLGLPKEALDTFPWDFRDGMTSPLRSKILADRGHNDPANWEWGGSGAEPDLLVILYATEREIAKLARVVEDSWGNAFQEVGRRHRSHQCPEKGHTTQDDLRACPKVGYRLMRDPWVDDDRLKPDPWDGSTRSDDDDSTDSDGDDSARSSKLAVEHFGFADGLSQPAIETSPRSRKFRERRDFDAIVRSGEFILGYVNERGQLPISPSIEYAPGTELPVITYADRSLGENPPVRARKPGPVATLFWKWGRFRKIWESWFKTRPGRWSDKRRLDFGRNGTFLVYRQLEQDVFAFDALIQQASKQPGYDTEYRLSDEAEFRRMLAAKMVGRWDDGTPLTLEPRSPHEGDSLRAVNNFGYADEDAHGLRCPIGAHIRRANPRDTLEPDPMNAMRRNNRHRLLRRGRVYGPGTTWRAWDDHGRNKDGTMPRDNYERGLHFICINASIESQFEFIQQTWMNASFFGGLSEEVDPLVGASDNPDRSFTVQGAPIGRRIEWTEPTIGPLVKVKGGAYFFLPGRKALAHLATEPGRSNTVMALPDHAPR